MIHEITNSDWPAFCQRLTQEQAGAMVKLETIETNGIKTEQVASAIFETIVFNRTDTCNDVIILRLRDNREIVHQILEPFHITLYPSGESGAFNPLQIVGENGTFLITFHPAIHALGFSDTKGGSASTSR